MFTRPNGLSDDDVRHALEVGWGVRVDTIAYVPVGFGSYHWRADGHGARWFVTVDGVTRKRRTRTESHEEPLQRLVAALSTARELRDAGLAFVVAPERTRAGPIVQVVRDRWAVALYPFFDAEPHEFGPYPTRDARLAVLDLLATLHRAPESMRPSARRDDFFVRHRDELLAAFDELETRWEAGPFAEPARALLARHASAVARLLDHYDRLAASVGQRPERFALTHGEPHLGNTLTTTDGVLLIDWDTALLAPPERDLWALGDEDPQMAADYAARTGVTPGPDALELYRLGWDLAEIAIYVAMFRAPHVTDDDTELSWHGLERHLDPSRWPTVP